MLQSVAECCRVLQSVTVCCRVLQYDACSFRLMIAMSCRQVGLVILDVKLLGLPAQSLIESPGTLTMFKSDG